MVFELIPPGTFMMGSPEHELKLKGDDEADDREVPRRGVSITKPLYRERPANSRLALGRPIESDGSRRRLGRLRPRISWPKNNYRHAVVRQNDLT
jgi:hypothetical protein